ncbi:MAG: conjugative transposon protein TraM [Fulvivirga sp.]
MKNLRKDQIIVLASVAGLFLLVIVMTYFKFFTTSETAVKKEPRERSLPTIPENPEVTYDTRIEHAEQIRRERERKKRIESVKSEIDLNVFNTGNSESEKKDNGPVEAPVSDPKPSLASSNTPTTTYAPSNKKPTQTIKQGPKQVIEEPEEQLDPDLFFADPTFTDGNQATTLDNVENEILQVRIPAVIQDEVTVTNGGRVTIRTTEEASINGKVIPRNTYIQTIARFGKRVKLEVPPINAKDGSVIAKSFIIIDANDNIEGIYSQELLDSEITRDQSQNIANELARESDNTLIRSGLRSISNKKIQETKIILKRNQPIYIQSKS